MGLGNPEKKYEKTFHNMGFIAAGDAAEKLDVKFKKKECEASVTYMNNSGRAVKQLAAKYKVPPEHVAVIYDDYDLPKGKIRIRPEGSAGTHNGMRSVIGETGWTNFPRIRIGIRDAAVNIPIIDYVLSEIRKDDYELFAEACGRAADAAIAFAGGMKIEDVMNKFNG